MSNGINKVSKGFSKENYHNLLDQFLDNQLIDEDTKVEFFNLLKKFLDSNRDTKKLIDEFSKDYSYNEMVKCLFTGWIIQTLNS
jgi:hypothetical protein